MPKEGKCIRYCSFLVLQSTMKQMMFLGPPSVMVWINFLTIHETILVTYFNIFPAKFFFLVISSFIDRINNYKKEKKRILSC